MAAHRAVLLAETVAHLHLQLGNTAIDGTCGAGGHTAEIARAVGGNGTVIALDQDEAALELATKQLASFSQIRFVHANFRDLCEVLGSLEIGQVDAICADLGVASFHFDDPERGFSFRSEVELDSRLDRRMPDTAADLLATLPEEELGRIFREYGEERRWRALAKAIVAERQDGKRFTGVELRELVRRVKGPGKPGRRKTIDPATQVFQALRIAVNDELGALRDFLPAAVEALRPGGRLAVIAYHSLEDRIVKRFFMQEEKGCICPPGLPICGCGFEPRLTRITRHPIVPTEEETRQNPRARSAKLRVAEKQ